MDPDLSRRTPHFHSHGRLSFTMRQPPSEILFQVHGSCCWDATRNLSSSIPCATNTSPGPWSRVTLLTILRLHQELANIAIIFPSTSSIILIPWPVKLKSRPYLQLSQPQERSPRKLNLEISIPTFAANMMSVLIILSRVSALRFY
jgi:hypothetical protein